MAKNNNLTDFLTDVADAIREKKGTTDKINPQDFSSEIKSIIAGDVQMPNVSGTLVITEGITEEDYEALKMILGNNITIDAQGGIYIHFEDPEVFRVLLEKITTDDDVGLTREDIEGVTGISTWFKGNTAIKTFNEFDKFTGVKSLATDAFSGSTIESITIPDSVTSIAQQAFTLCSNLVSVENLSHITSVGVSAFRYCSNLELDITNIDQITTLRTYAFNEAKKVYGEVNMPLLKTIEYLAFGSTAITKIVNLGSIETMGSQICQKCTALTEVTFQSTLLTISSSAFADCSSLHTINFSEGLTSIGDSAFSNCTSLIEVSLPKSLATLGAFSFRGCSNLAKVELGDIVNGSDIGNINTQAFNWINTLKTIIIHAAVPPTLGTSAIPGNTTVYVPDTSVNAYRAATNWSALGDRIKGISEMPAE